jgi:hypothetical protein
VNDGELVSGPTVILKGEILSITAHFKATEYTKKSSATGASKRSPIQDLTMQNIT